MISRTKYSRKILIISIADRSIDCLLAGTMTPQIELFAIYIYPHAIYQGTRLIRNLFHTIELQCVKLTHRMKQSWKYHFKETPKRTRNVKIVYCLLRLCNIFAGYYLQQYRRQNEHGPATSLHFLSTPSGFIGFTTAFSTTPSAAVAEPREDKDDDEDDTNSYQDGVTDEVFSILQNTDNTFLAWNRFLHHRPFVRGIPSRRAFNAKSVCDFLCSLWC